MTPLVQFGDVYLKHEDQNLTGSAKDRAIELQIDNLISQGYKSAVISSTGNAAISAQYFCHLKKIPLTIFVSPNINPHKLLTIKNKNNSKIFKSNQPISDAFKFAKTNNAYLLRQSTDPIALLGYQKISQELIAQLPKITSIFIPVGSGTTLLGISQSLPQSVKIFAVQPASHCPIASYFDKNFQSENSTVTDALSVKLLPLKKRVIDACFSGVVIQNQNIIQQDIPTSPEGNLAYAGFLKVKNSQPVGDYPVILLTGAVR
ncbi:PLP-dependent lyase/thiolase [Candidatus Shapirobacteria bacterium]|nr:PLP-dependent lyase/thiolase [Candidatus Shapirobacteria bacterium]